MQMDFLCKKGVKIRRVLSIFKFLLRQILTECTNVINPAVNEICA